MEHGCHCFVRNLQLTGRTRFFGENYSWEISARTRRGPPLSPQHLQLCVSVSATEETHRVQLALAISMLAGWQMSPWKSIWGFFSALDLQGWHKAQPPANPTCILCCHPGTQKEMGQWICQLKFQETLSSLMPVDKVQLKIKGRDAFTFPWLNLAWHP